MMENKTFIEITNRDIFDKLEELKTHIMKTNGKVRLNRWIGTTALSISTILIGVLSIK